VGELPDGWKTYVPQRYWLKRSWRVKDECKIDVTLASRHPSLPDVYQAQAVFGQDIILVPDWVNMSDLEPHQ